MAFFKIKIDGKDYELDRLTLGDAQILKRDFGLHDLEMFSPSDPDQLLGIVALTISKTDGKTLAEAIAEAKDIDIAAIQPQDDEPEEDPTPAADNAATDDPPKSGKSGKRPKTTGNQD